MVPERGNGSWRNDLARAKPPTKWNVLLEACLALDTDTNGARRFVEFLDIGL